MSPLPSITVIIPARNEEKYIGGVLQVLTQIPEITEIIAIDDGSTDGTCHEIEKYTASDPRLRCIQLPSNQGKAAAMFAGTRQAAGKVLVFLDADLCNLKPIHVRDLFIPVCELRAEMVVGLFKGGHFNTSFPHWLTPWTSGQRCLPADLFSKVPPGTSAGYGIETGITLTANRLGWKCLYVPLKDVWHPPSEFHRGIFYGIYTRIKMYWEIVKTLWAEGGWYLLGPRLRAGKRYPKEPRKMEG